MRCKIHDADRSCVVGVCASCVRERLSRVILAEEESESQSVYQNYCNSNTITVTNPTLRRSVSPYINRQKSINAVNPVAIVQRPYNKPRLNHSVSDRRFYNSPQIALNTGGCIGGTSSSNRKKQSFIRFSSISNMFRSNSRKRDADSDSNHQVSVSSSSERCGAGGRPRPSSVTPSPSWFSNVLPTAGVRQKNKAFYDESSTICANIAVRRQLCVPDRGMSPVRSSDDGDEDEFSEGSSVYESAESCKQTLKKTPSPHTFRRGGASPKSNLNLKGKLPVDGGFSGDIGAPAVFHISNAKLFSGNRSRKFADFGRSDPNR